MGGTSAKTANALAREDYAMQLHLAGMTLTQIGRALGEHPEHPEWRGVNRQRAHAIVWKGMSRHHRATSEQLRATLLARLERMHRALWPTALALPREGERVLPTPEDQGRAVLRCLQIADRVAKLENLIAPETPPTESPEERADRLAERWRDFQAGAKAQREVAAGSVHTNDDSPA